MTITGPDGLQHLPPPEHLPAHAMKTYHAASPQRPATCEEVACGNYLNGWRLRLEDLTPEQLHVARTCGRKFTEVHVAEGVTLLVYEAGQPCFRAALHRLPWDGRERFFERGGDWRGNPRGDIRELRPDDWVDSFATHQDRLADRLERG